MVGMRARLAQAGGVPFLVVGPWTRGPLYPVPPQPQLVPVSRCSKWGGEGLGVPWLGVWGLVPGFGAGVWTPGDRGGDVGINRHWWYPAGPWSTECHKLVNITPGGM